MKVIGHRGAAGLALENTIESISAAIQAGVDAIEFDIRVTQDGELVLSHDKHLGRVSKQASNITKSSLATLKTVRLHNGEEIVTLSEAVRTADGLPLIIEAKKNGWARPLAAFLRGRKNVDQYKVISFNHRELYTFHTLVPEVAVYALEDTKPFDVIRTAKVLGFTGIDINFWLLNPFTYYLARHYKLNIMVYTVNKAWIARFLRMLYPAISITTDVPHELQFLRRSTTEAHEA